MIPIKISVFVDITGRGAAWISAAGEVSSGDHKLSQKWSRALYEHPEEVDGILYRCRHDQEKQSVALFDREPGILSVELYTKWSDLNPLLGNLLDYYKMGLA